MISESLAASSSRTDDDEEDDDDGDGGDDGDGMIQCSVAFNLACIVA